MSNQTLDNSVVSTHLGKTSQYKSTYDASLLVRELRSNNRKYLGIEDNALPFIGYDVWNAYECSFLLTNGCPVAGAVKLRYSCGSKYIVESKSIKLYFNSFNMQKMGPTISDGIECFKSIVSSDLSVLLGTEVTVGFIPCHIGNLTSISPDDFYGISTYETLELSFAIEELQAITFDTYKETPDLLTKGDRFEEEKGQRFHSALLKSNCRVTSQPDWGDVFIHIKTKYQISKADLIKYVVSFRGENHFHEEICECIYKRLHDIYEPSELMVACLYARRGGIDINPIRASNSTLMHEFSVHFLEVNTPHVKLAKQ